MVQFVYNTSVYKATKQTPFFANHRFYPIIYKILTIRLDNLYVVIKIKHFKFLYNRFKNEFSFVKNQITKYYNIKKMKRLSFEKEGKVYLLYKNIIIKRLNNKLDFKKFRSFTIIQKILELNYKLLLFKTI